ncbi:MAG TPA: DUF4010 domain-containing protein [Planctomycetes bacterium]|nr:DUF4010 domain-containing protein [Planctomycetota bacterium]
MEPTAVVFQKLAVALLLGLLVGLQRQHAASGIAGLRTFPLITVLGAVTGWLANELGGWVVAAAMLGIAAVLVFPNLVRIRRADPDPGTTTDVAVLLMYSVGALLALLPREQMGVPIVIGGGVAVLLQFKMEMHRFVEKLGDRDLRAIMQFVLVTCIVLPVLPNRDFGPTGLEVFNPFKTWLMVVLIVGMSLSGYITYKFLGRDAGILLGGILGGVISSTATTVSYARRAREDPGQTRAAAIIIMIASTVVFLRVLVEMAVVAPAFFFQAAAPVLLVMGLCLVPSLVLWYQVRREPSRMPEQANPTQLKSALVFAAMYAVVLFALAAARQYLGGQGLYPVAVLSGLTDMDAITLSTAHMARTDPQVFRVGWRLIVAASLANMVFKAAVVAMIGHRQLLGRVCVLFALPLAGGLALVLLWPW